MRRLVPHALTSVRLLAAIGLMLPLVSSENWAWFAVLGAGTDFFDGHLARRWQQESNFGASFDLFADGVFFLAFVCAFWNGGYFPTWLLVLLLSSAVPELAALAVFAKKGAKPGSPGRLWNRLSGGYAYCCVLLVSVGAPAVPLGLGQAGLAWCANLMDLRLALSIRHSSDSRPERSRA